MRTIALSLLLIFSTFTAVLCTYYLWMDSDFTIVMPVEEEEDHSKNQSNSFKVIFSSNKTRMALLSDADSKICHDLYNENNYEEVYLSMPLPPPDVM